MDETTDLTLKEKLMPDTLTLTVNGKPYTLPLIPKEKLSDLLRSRLNLTGTKVGCGEGRCGACTVLVDGKPVKSCLTQAASVDGKSVLTVEGLRALRPASRQHHREDLRALHPLQEAFVTHGAIQCGFCTPGQLMTAYALLQENPDPSFDEIRAALNDVLCRCGSYAAILSAVGDAARALREDGEVNRREVPFGAQDLRAVGKFAIRPDAVAKVTGQAVFTDDLSFEGMLYARVVRANVPSAILTSLDTAQARLMPGVATVLTAADLPAARLHGIYFQDWPILVDLGGRVRYMGDALALVAADTQQHADEAAKAVKVAFEPRPVVASPQEALSPDAEPLHAQGNLLKHIQVRKGDTQSGFEAADVILEHTFTTPATDHFFMEPECSIAVPRPDGGMDIFVGSQIPYADRRQVAEALGVPELSVRVRGQKTGGGFGGKEDIAGQIHAALLAQATGKPVKLLFTRRESLLVHPKRHATQIRVRLGAKQDGTLTAAETELYGDTGAYASLGVVVMTRATTHSCGPYVVPNVKSDCYAMFTNNPPAGAFRGFGVLQSAFAIESAMDMLAGRLGLDPLAIRQINALHTGAQTNTGQLLEESVGLPDCLQAIANRWQERGITRPFVPVLETRAGRQVLTCWGMAAAFKNTGLGSGADDSSGAIVTLLPHGRLQVKTAASEIGQGLVTAMQLIAAEEMSFPVENVNVYVMDTDLTPDGGPTTASRQTFVTGNAVKSAAGGLRARVVEMVSLRFEVEPAAVRLTPEAVWAGEQRVDWQQVYELLNAAPEGTAFETRYQAPQTSKLEQGGNIHFAYSFAAQAVQIALDLESGAVSVEKVLSANDAGRIINPLGFQGQVEGGVVMGLGHALMEEFKVEKGVILSDRIARYPIPRMQDAPEVESYIVEAPASSGPFGAKGTGEIVSIPTPPAIANAIYHATGFRADSLPIRAEQVRAWLEEHPVLGDSSPDGD